METVNGVTDGDKGGPPPPSPLTGCYLLIVVGEPHSEQHKDIILQRIAKGLLSWDVTDCLVDLEKELAIITEQALEGEEARYGERLIQFASENLVTEILIHPVVSTLAQCIRNLLSSFTRHRHIIHAGYTFAANGSWALQDGTFSVADFSEAFQELDVQRVIRAYDNGISLDLHCSPEGDWSRLPKEPFAKACKVRVNPTDVLTTGSPSITNFVNYISPFLVSTSLENLLESSDVVGNIRFSRPTLYVFPGGQGDAALFGINGFNMLLDGGFSRKACFWDFVRHLDRLDAVLMTRLNNSNVGGISSVLRRKKQDAVYPQIGHFFCNIQERKAILSPDGDKDKDPLLINLLDEGHEIISNLRHLNLHPQVCYRDSEPINLYHKVGHGTLDMYVLSPAKDSKEVREFLQKWNQSDQKLFANTRSSREFSFPVQNLISIAALLVWQPANPSDTITRILYPGSSPQKKIFEGLDRLKNLEFIKHPVCTEKSLVPSTTAKKSVKDALLDKVTPKEKITEKKENKIIENNVSLNGEIKEAKERLVRKSDSTESERSTRTKKMEDTKIIENEEKSKAKPKAPKVRSESQQRKKLMEKKASPTTPKKTVENGDVRKPIKRSPIGTPAKSAKDANNRKVIESKTRTVKPPPPEPKPKVERKPISRRPKGTMKAPISPAKKLVNGVQKPDSISKKGKLDKEGTTDSSTVSTPSADQESLLKKDISKLTPEEMQQLKAQELADLKEEQEAVKEIEAVFRKGEVKPSKDDHLRKVKDVSIEDKAEKEEYLIIEKEEIDHDSLDEKEVKEDEIQKLARDSEESEKQRKLSSEEKLDKQQQQAIAEQVNETEAEDVAKTKEETVETSKDTVVTSPEDKLDLSSTDKKTTDKEIEEVKDVIESQPDEKVSIIKSGDTTTAPTLPEDERIPLDEIKEDNGQIIEEKHVKEDTKEKEVPLIQLPPKTFEPVAKVPGVVGIRLDKQPHIRDIVKTPDEVADLPVHEEVDYEYTHELKADARTNEIIEEHKDDKVDEKLQHFIKDTDQVMGLIKERVKEVEQEKDKDEVVQEQLKEIIEEVKKTSVMQEELKHLTDKVLENEVVLEKDILKDAETVLGKEPLKSPVDIQQEEETKKPEEATTDVEAKVSSEDIMQKVDPKMKETLVEKEDLDTEKADKLQLDKVVKDVDIVEEKIEKDLQKDTTKTEKDKDILSTETKEHVEETEPTKDEKVETKIDKLEDKHEEIESKKESHGIKELEGDKVLDKDVPKKAETQVKETIKDLTEDKETIKETIVKEETHVDDKERLVSKDTDEKELKTKEKEPTKDTPDKSIDHKELVEEREEIEKNLEKETDETKSIELDKGKADTFGLDKVIEEFKDTEITEDKDKHTEQVSGEEILEISELETKEKAAEEVDKNTGLVDKTKIEEELKDDTKDKDKKEIEKDETTKVEVEKVEVETPHVEIKQPEDTQVFEEETLKNQLEGEKIQKDSLDQINIENKTDKESKEEQLDHKKTTENIKEIATKNDDLEERKEIPKSEDKISPKKEKLDVSEKQVETKKEKVETKASETQKEIEEVDKPLTNGVVEEDSIEDEQKDEEDKRKDEAVRDMKLEKIEQSKQEIKSELEKKEDTDKDKTKDKKPVADVGDEKKKSYERIPSVEEMQTKITKQTEDVVKTAKEDTSKLEKIEDKLQHLKEKSPEPAIEIIEPVKLEKELGKTGALVKGTKEDKEDLEKLEDKLQQLKESAEVKIEPIQETKKDEDEDKTTTEVIEKADLGRKSPMEREEDVIKIVATVAEVLKSDAPLEEFEGKLPISTYSPYTTSYTTELRETHITTVDSPITESRIIKPDDIPPIPEEPHAIIASFLEEERKIAPVHEQIEDKRSSLLRESQELMMATSKMISDIKSGKPEEKEDEPTVVHRMLVTASSEDGGEEIELCPEGTISFSKSSESSGRSSPEKSQELSKKSSIVDTISDTLSTVKQVRELHSEKDSGIDDVKSDVDLETQEKLSSPSDTDLDKPPTKETEGISLEKGDDQISGKSSPDKDASIKSIASGKSTPDMSDLPKEITSSNEDIKKSADLPKNEEPIPSVPLKDSQKSEEDIKKELKPEPVVEKRDLQETETTPKEESIPKEISTSKEELTPKELTTDLKKEDGSDISVEKIENAIKGQLETVTDFAKSLFTKGEKEIEDAKLDLEDKIDEIKVKGEDIASKTVEKGDKTITEINEVEESIIEQIEDKIKDTFDSIGGVIASFMEEDKSKLEDASSALSHKAEDLEQSFIHKTDEKIDQIVEVIQKELEDKSKADMEAHEETYKKEDKHDGLKEDKFVVDKLEEGFKAGAELDKISDSTEEKKVKGQLSDDKKEDIHDGLKEEKSVIDKLEESSKAGADHLLDKISDSTGELAEAKSQLAEISHVVTSTVEDIKATVEDVLTRKASDVVAAKEIEPPVSKAAIADAAEDLKAKVDEKFAKKPEETVDKVQTESSEEKFDQSVVPVDSAKESILEKLEETTKAVVDSVLDATSEKDETKDIATSMEEATDLGHEKRRRRSVVEQLEELMSEMYSDKEAHTVAEDKEENTASSKKTTEPAEVEKKRKESIVEQLEEGIRGTFSAISDFGKSLFDKGDKVLEDSTAKTEHVVEDIKTTAESVIEKVDEDVQASIDSIKHFDTTDKTTKSPVDDVIKDTKSEPVDISKKDITLETKSESLPGSDLQIGGVTLDKEDLLQKSNLKEESKEGKLDEEAPLTPIKLDGEKDVTDIKDRKLSSDLTKEIKAQIEEDRTYPDNKDSTGEILDLSKVELSKTDETKPTPDLKAELAFAQVQDISGKPSPKSSPSESPEIKPDRKESVSELTKGNIKEETTLKDHAVSDLKPEEKDLALGHQKKEHKEKDQVAETLHETEVKSAADSTNIEKSIEDLTKIADIKVEETGKDSVLEYKEKDILQKQDVSEVKSEIKKEEKDLDTKKDTPELTSDTKSEIKADKPRIEEKETLEKDKESVVKLEIKGDKDDIAEEKDSGIFESISENKIESLGKVDTDKEDILDKTAAIVDVKDSKTDEGKVSSSDEASLTAKKDISDVRDEHKPKPEEAKSTISSDKKDNEDNKHDIISIPLEKSAHVLTDPIVTTTDAKSPFGKTEERLETDRSPTKAVEDEKLLEKEEQILKKSADDLQQTYDAVSQVSESIVSGKNEKPSAEILDDKMFKKEEKNLESAKSISETDASKSHPEDKDADEKSPEKVEDLTFDKCGISTDLDEIDPKVLEEEQKQLEKSADDLKNTYDRVSKMSTSLSFEKCDKSDDVPQIPEDDLRNEEKALDEKAKDLTEAFDTVTDMSKSVVFEKCDKPEDAILHKEEKTLEKSAKDLTETFDTVTDMSKSMVFEKCDSVDKRRKSIEDEFAGRTADDLEEAFEAVTDMSKSVIFEKCDKEQAKKPDSIKETFDEKTDIKVDPTVVNDVVDKVTKDIDTTYLEAEIKTPKDLPLSLSTDIKAKDVDVEAVVKNVASDINTKSIEAELAKSPELLVEEDKKTTVPEKCDKEGMEKDLDTTQVISIEDNKSKAELPSLEKETVKDDIHTLDSQDICEKSSLGVSPTETKKLSVSDVEISLPDSKIDTSVKAIDDVKLESRDSDNKEDKQKTDSKDTEEKCDKTKESPVPEKISVSIAGSSATVDKSNDLEEAVEAAKQKELQDTLHHEKHIPGARTPPTVPVSPNVMECYGDDIKLTPRTESLIKDMGIRSSTPGSDDFEIITSTQSDISSGQVSKMPLDSEKLDSDEELSVTSQVAYSRESSHYEFEDDSKISSKIDPMSMSFYGALPDDEPTEDKEVEPTYLYEITNAKYSSASLGEADAKLNETDKNKQKEDEATASSASKDAKDPIGASLGEADPKLNETDKNKQKEDEATASSASKDAKDPIGAWGKPLGLPAPSTYLYEITRARYSAQGLCFAPEQKQDESQERTYLYEVTTAKYSGKFRDLDHINQNEGRDMLATSCYGEFPSNFEDKDPIASWGKPLGLPSPAPPSDNKGTPKKERKLPANVTAKNKLNDDRKRAESPSKYRNKKVNPVYVDLTYVPHHGNTYYSYVDFFKRVRARYYVFSGIEPSREVYNALLEAKQTWEDKELEVTIIPTYDTDILGYWVAENEELLAKCKIDLSPSASRCTINLQDHETSCSAYRLEF